MFFYESNRYGGNDEFVIAWWESLNFPLHLHRCFELVFVTEGELSISVDMETKTLSEGEMCLIFPNQLHAYKIDAFSKGFYCIFSPEYVNLFYHYCKNKKPQDLVTDFSSETKALVKKKLAGCKDNKFMIKACLYAVCAEISEKTTLVETKLGSNEILLHKILCEIEDHFAEDISLKAIAQKLGYDYHYLSRYFNVQLHIPFSRMLNERKIDYAAYLILNSDKSITEIALSCGYKNIRSFNRNFIRILNQAPSEYKKLKCT